MPVLGKFLEQSFCGLRCSNFGRVVGVRLSCVVQDHSVAT